MDKVSTIKVTVEFRPEEFDWLRVLSINKRCTVDEMVHWIIAQYRAKEELKYLKTWLSNHRHPPYNKLPRGRGGEGRDR